MSEFRHAGSHLLAVTLQKVRTTRNKASPYFCAVLYVTWAAPRCTHLLADYVVDLGQDALESQLHVGALQSRGLDKAEALLLAELLRVLRRDAPQVPARQGRGASITITTSVKVGDNGTCERHYRTTPFLHHGYETVTFRMMEPNPCRCHERNEAGSRTTGLSSTGQTGLLKRSSLRATQTGDGVPHAQSSSL